MAWLKKIVKSFKYALMGLGVAATERNFIIQLTIGATAIIFSIVLELSFIERIIILLCVALVLASEAMNSAVERLLDFVSQERIEEIREVKDLMAGAVLIFSVAALVIGVMIFGNALLAG